MILDIGYFNSLGEFKVRPNQFFDYWSIRTLFSETTHLSRIGIRNADDSITYVYGYGDSKDESILDLFHYLRSRHIRKIRLINNIEVPLSLSKLKELS